jgi:hypothetical protein
MNYAYNYARSAWPEADVVAVGASSAFGRAGDIVFICAADAVHHTRCNALADYSPKKPPAESPKP